MGTIITAIVGFIIGLYTGAELMLHICEDYNTRETKKG